MIGKFSGLLASVSAMAFANAAWANVEISNRATVNLDCQVGTCTATAKKAVLNVGDLQAMLAGGDVAVKTGTLAKDIDIDQPLTWSSTSRLTLDAQRCITAKKPVSVTGTGALTIIYNDGASDGDLLFVDKGSVTFWDANSNLVINGQSYTLVKGIATLAADIAANPSGFYALANSYDAKHDRFDNVPIPTKFSGTLEGLGHSIAHLKIKKSILIKIGASRFHVEGLFGYVTSGVIRDLVLAKASVSAKRTTYVGTLAGRNSGAIMHVASDGSVTAENGQIGGLVGTNDGTIVNASADVTVVATGSANAGGLAGDSVSGSIFRSHATGSVSGHSAGGLAGIATNVIQSYATRPVAGVYEAGGLIGAGSEIDQSYATGAVTAGDKATAGGLIGVGRDIGNCYAMGSVSAQRKSLAGGFAGRGYQISASYSIGSLSAGEESFAGGFVGKNDLHNSLTDVYWDTETAEVGVGCGKGDCTGVTGLTTQELQSGLPSGFDPKLWGQQPDINGGFPYLLGLPPN